MFDHKHYVPVLRWKKAEQEAMRRLFEHEKLQLTPLLEIPARRPFPKKDAPPPKRPKVKGDWMVEIGASLVRSWGTLRPAFAEICPEVTDPDPLGGIAWHTEHLFTVARDRKVKLIPVVRLAFDPSRRNAIKRIVVQDQHGVCIRLSRSDLSRATLDHELSELLQTLSVNPEQVDLVVDLHIVDDGGFDLLLICGQVPYLQQWRTFTVVGGAFPSGLAKSPYGLNSFGRSEWRAWSEQVQRVLPRKPAYGDYTTVHPVPFDPNKHPTPCANIRYTTELAWMVYKGLPLVAKDAKPTDPSRHEQYPAIAFLMEEHEFYAGDSFSFGDQYLHSMAEKCRGGDLSSPGTPTTWLTAAINHHLTYMVIQIDKLFVASSSAERENAAVPGARPLQPAHVRPPSVSSRSPGLHRGTPAG